MKEVKRVIDGVQYTAQYRGLKYANEISEHDATRQFDLAGVLFREVLVSPKIEIDDFSDMRTFSKVFDFLLEVAVGAFEKQRTPAQTKEHARNNMACWRLIFSDMSNLDYNTVFHQMTPQEIEEANAALDIIAAEVRRKTNKK